MDNGCHISFFADDRSYFANIKKQIRQYVAKLQLATTRGNEVDIIVAEITSNLLKHTDSGGEILATCRKDETGEYLEIISLDNGPGLYNVDKVMEDGYSTTGTLGAGLGSIKGLSDVFEIYTYKSWGTVLLSRVYKNPVLAKALPKKNYGAIIVAKPGEACSGDGYCVCETENGFKILHADGLGHGPEAKHAVDVAVQAFTACKETTPIATITHLHERLLKTRGIVANVIFYNKPENSWNMAGVGNISTRWAGTKGERNYTPDNGIIGHLLASSFNDLVLSGKDYQLLVSCSDGIKTRWNLERSKAARLHSPLIQAAAIYKDFSRRTDDASVVVCKIN
jgi:anti-sigma regulatory factor (Ser/Thr protein kinase)